MFIDLNSYEEQVVGKIRCINISITIVMLKVIGLNVLEGGRNSWYVIQSLPTTFHFRPTQLWMCNPLYYQLCIFCPNVNDVLQFSKMKVMDMWIWTMSFFILFSNWLHEIVFETFMYCMSNNFFFFGIIIHQNFTSGSYINLIYFLLQFLKQGDT